MLWLSDLLLRAVIKANGRKYPRYSVLMWERYSLCWPFAWRFLSANAGTLKSNTFYNTMKNEVHKKVKRRVVLPRGMMVSCELRVLLNARWNSSRAEIIFCSLACVPGPAVLLLTPGCLDLVSAIVLVAVWSVICAVPSCWAAVLLRSQCFRYWFELNAKVFCGTAETWKRLRRERGCFTKPTKQITIKWLGWLFHEERAQKHKKLLLGSSHHTPSFEMIDAKTMWCALNESTVF